MIKPKISPLIVLTSLFLLFLVLFFQIRNDRRIPVQVSHITATEATIAFEDAPDADMPVNLNTATVEELAALPGIGETLARRIILYRRTHGRFHSEDQLLNVEGIGAGKLNAILDLITTGGR